MQVPKLLSSQQGKTVPGLYAAIWHGAAGTGENMPTTRAVSSSFVGLRLRDELRLKLEELARREEVSLAQIIRWAIRDYLAKRWNELKN